MKFKTIRRLLALMAIFGCNTDDANLVEPTNNNPTSFVLSQSLSAILDKERLGLDIPWSDFEATGLYAPPNSVLTVKVENIIGNTLPVLLIGTYSRYESKINPTEIELETGTNVIPIDQYGGLIYLRYTTEILPVLDKVKINFIDGFLKAPFYIKNRTTNSQWKKQLELYQGAPDVTVLTDKTIQVYSLQNALLWKDKDIATITEYIDQIIEVENEISGLQKNSQNPLDKTMLHKILMTETDISDAYMYATWYRTVYHQEVAEFAFTDIISVDGWGPWHELGHMHQQSAWTWDACSEVTVNIYTLAVERHFGIRPSRLVRENVWDSAIDFINNSSINKNFNDDDQIDVFTRLCMFEQLRLFYGDAFIVELHKQTRLENPVLNTDKEKMEYFMVKASSVCGNDLSEFFAKWGFIDVNDGYSLISNLNLPVASSDLMSVRE